MKFFFLFLTFGAYALSKLIASKLRNPIFNPLLVSVVIILAVLFAFHLDYNEYLVSVEFINMMLVPATAALGYTIYRQKEILKEHFLSITLGSATGAGISLLTVFLMGKALGLDQITLSSLLAKSVTTPIAIEITASLGGIPAITVFAVIVTGIMGNLLAPMLIKLFHTDNKIAQGVGIGCCSHAVGTSKAITLGSIQGAASSIALAFCGLFTLVFSLFL